MPSMAMCVAGVMVTFLTIQYIRSIYLYLSMKFELKRNMRKIRDLYYETSIRFHLTDFQKLSCYGETCTVSNFADPLTDSTSHAKNLTAYVPIIECVRSAGGPGPEGHDNVR